MAANKTKPKGPKPDKSFLDALRISVNEVDPKSDSGKKKLRRIADQLVKKALEGDVQAINHIADRLDGKPRQAVELSDPDGKGVFSSMNFVFNPVGPTIEPDKN